MSATKKNILFITPTLANTGSEILLFNFINFLVGYYNIAVICFKNGQLIKDLNPSVKVHILNFETPQNTYQKIVRRLKLDFIIPALFKKYKNYNWYINTLVLPVPVKYAVKHHIHFILHAHELQPMYRLLSTEQLSAALNRPKLLIANSAVTRQHLINAGSRLEIPVITPFIDLPAMTPFIQNRVRPVAGKYCWVMAGSIDNNKNPLLFVKIAAEAKKQNLPYTFTWLYNVISDPVLFSEVQSSLQRQNCQVEFIQTNNYTNYLPEFSKADGLLLTSTYESFSMITLEALAMGMPVVVNDCGGVREIINDQTASIIPLNTDPAIYLKAMGFELERSGLLRAEKNKLASSFDKTKILPAWEKLMLSAIE